MRLDPLDNFSHTIVSLPVRLILIWATGTAGAFAPIFIQAGIDAFDVIGWQFLFFPFYLFILPFVSGWWGIFGFPLLIAFTWKSIAFLREESDAVALFWIFFLPYLIGIRMAGDRWPLAVILAVVTAWGVLHHHRSAARAYIMI